MKAENESPYELCYPSPLTSGTPEQIEAMSQGLPMLVALEGFADAGMAVGWTAEHIMRTLNCKPVAEINIDEFYDYRSRRPTVVLHNSARLEKRSPTLTLQWAEDMLKRPFLLLTGPEPDFRWEGFANTIGKLARMLNVNQVVTLYSVPMPVPHTRPVVISGHSNDSLQLKEVQRWSSNMVFPSGAALFVEERFQGLKIPTLGLCAHVPQYAETYPAAVVALLKAFGYTAKRRIPLEAIEASAKSTREELDSKIAANPEVNEEFAALERRFDADQERRKRKEDSPLLGPGEAIPSGDELGAELERYLDHISQVQNESDADGPETDPFDDPSHPED